MKKLNLFLGLGAIALSLFFTSCEEEVNPKPVITFDQTSPLALASGETTAVLTGTIVAEASLSKIETYKITGLSEELIETITSFSSGAITTTDDVNYTFRFNVDVTEDVTFKITATDKDEQVISKSIEITAAEGASLSTFTAVLMGGQSNLDYGSYLDADEGDVYKQAEAESNSALIDVVYYHGTTNAATLTAPDDATVNGGDGNLSLCASFSTKNATRFASSSLSFDDATAADLAGISVSNSKMTQLAQGDVIEFETEGGKKGLIKVASISTGSSGTITIDVKIEQ